MITSKDYKYLNIFILGQLFDKSLTNTLNRRIYPSYMSTFPKIQLEDKPSVEGTFQF